MLKCPQYFYLNSLKRLCVEGEGKARISQFSNQVSVSLVDSTGWQKETVSCVLLRKE